MGLREREGPEISALRNWVEDGTIHMTGKAASWVGGTGVEFPCGCVVGALHVRIPSGDNISQLEPGERSERER